VSLDPNTLRFERHEQIGRLLREHGWLIIDRWCSQAALQQPRAKRVHHQTLLDHLPELLDAMATGLADGLAGERHHDQAQEHGKQRWQAGWTLGEVIRDYQILRVVVLDVLDEVLDRPLTAHEGIAVGLAIDEAIAESVSAYVVHRDEAERQREAEHVAKLLQAQTDLERQSKQLEVADYRKNEFLAILAHELRNPLAPLRNAALLLRMRESLASNDRWLLDVLDRQLEQLTRLVDDLLDISRITRGSLHLDSRPVDLGVVAQRALEIAQPLISKHCHRLRAAVPSQLCWVRGDDARLIQVLSNLLINAAKYTPDGGDIEFTMAADGTDVTVTVRDNGVGIAPDVLATIFNPFTQEHRILERAQGGLGLGLSLVQSLVDLHGGRVQAFSDGPGCGSRFVVTLPRLPNGAAAAEVRQSEAREAKSRRILIVDDNVDAASSLGLVLQLLGHDVQVVHNGAAAITLAEQFLPDVALLDIGMPGMDGYELARRLRATSQLQNIFLVAVTGYGQPDDRRRSHEAGIAAHLVKPLDLGAFQSLLAKL
jgi:signal transduction histidine kinase/CheY-like chemotaxis protein